MAYEISQELEAKLRILEIETDFFSRKPDRPTRSRYLVWLMMVVIIVGGYSAAISESPFQLAFFVPLELIITLFISTKSGYSACTQVRVKLSTITKRQMSYCQIWCLAI